MYQKLSSVYLAQLSLPLKLFTLHVDMVTGAWRALRVTAPESGLKQGVQRAWELRTKLCISSNGGCHAYKSNVVKVRLPCPLWLLYATVSHSWIYFRISWLRAAGWKMLLWIIKIIMQKQWFCFLLSVCIWKLPVMVGLCKEKKSSDKVEFSLCSTYLWSEIEEKKEISRVFKGCS